MRRVVGRARHGNVLFQRISGFRSWFSKCHSRRCSWKAPISGHGIRNLQLQSLESGWNFNLSFINYLLYVFRGWGMRNPILFPDKGSEHVVLLFQICLIGRVRLCAVSSELLNQLAPLQIRSDTVTSRVADCLRTGYLVPSRFDAVRRHMWLAPMARHSGGSQDSYDPSRGKGVCGA